MRGDAVSKVAEAIQARLDQHIRNTERLVERAQEALDEAWSELGENPETYPEGLKNLAVVLLCDFDTPTEYISYSYASEANP